MRCSSNCVGMTRLGMRSGGRFTDALCTIHEWHAPRRGEKKRNLQPILPYFVIFRDIS